MIEILELFSGSHDKYASRSNYKPTETNDIENLSKQIEAIKKNQMKTLELKNAITKLKAQWMSSKVEWIGQREKKSVIWKIGQ